MSKIYDPEALVCPRCLGRHRELDKCIRCNKAKPTYLCFLCNDCDILVITKQIELVKTKQKEEFITRLHRARLPERYVLSSPEWEMPSEIHKTLYRFTNIWTTGELEGTGLYISGKSGTGKTHLSCMALKTRMFNENSHGLYMNAPRTLNEVRNNLEQHSYLLSHFASVPLLVIDDFGSEQMTQWSYRFWKDLLDMRSKDDLNKPTIIATRLSPQDLNRKFEEYEKEEKGVLFRRIKENSKWLRTPQTPYPDSLTQGEDEHPAQGLWDTLRDSDCAPDPDGKRIELERALGQKSEQSQDPETED